MDPVFNPDSDSLHLPDASLPVSGLRPVQDDRQLIVRLRTESLALMRQGIEKEGWDRTLLARPFNEAVQKATTVSLAQVLRDLIAETHDGKNVYFGIQTFRACAGYYGVNATLTVGHIREAVQAQQFLSSLPHPFLESALQDLRKEVAARVIEKASQVELSIFLKLVTLDGFAAQDRGLPLDLYGEILDVFNEFREKGFDPETLDFVNRELGSLIPQVSESPRAYGSEFLSSIATNLAAFHQRERALQDPLGKHFYDFIKLPDTELSSRLILALEDIRTHETAPHLMRLLFASVPFITRAGAPELLDEVIAAVQEIRKISHSYQYVENLTQNFQEGKVPASEIHSRLKDLRADAAAKTLVDQDAHLQGSRQIHNPDRFRLWKQVLGRERMGVLYQDANLDLVNSVRSRLKQFEEFRDIAHGFAALMFESRRTPTRQPPLIAQFGRDVGKVSYLNSRETDAFPGRGVVISHLQLDRILVADEAAREAGKNPFHLYARAWPELAPHFRDFIKTQFLFSRGMIVVACTNARRFTIDVPSHGREHYSLVAFNAHFKNPDSRTVYAVPTALLRKTGISRTLVGMDDYTGFQPRKPDLNQLLPTPESLIHDEEFGHLIVEIGKASLLTQSIFPYKEPKDRWPEYERSLADYNGRMREWNNKGHEYHNSRAGYRLGMALMDEFEKLEKWRWRNEAQTREEAVYVAEKGNELLAAMNSYRRIIDLFLIANSLWQKGYTQGEAVQRPVANGDVDDFWAEESFAPKGDAEMRRSEGSEVFWNQNSIRMLAYIYEMNSQRRFNMADPNQYPIVMITEARRLSDLSANRVMIDTYTMKAHVGDKVIQLSPDEMTMDDESFWHNQIMPFAADKPDAILAIRPYPRQNIPT